MDTFWMMGMQEINDKMTIIYEKLNLEDARAGCKKCISATRLYDQCFPREKEYLTPELMARMLRG